MKVKKAIIPAAGLGTRFLPATKAQPKEMLPIVDKPTIQYIIEEAINSGIEDILIVTGRNKRAIEDHFDKSYELEMTLQEKGKWDELREVTRITNLAEIHYIRQKEALGLGHAILCARSFIGNEPFAVLLGDDVVVSKKPCLKQLIKIYEKHHTSVVGIQKVTKENVSKYGIINPRSNMHNDRLFHVSDMVEKPPIAHAPSQLAIMGRYVFTPHIFNYIDTKNMGTNGEIQLTDAMKRMNEDFPMLAYQFEGSHYDIGNKLGFVQATIDFALNRDDLREDILEYMKEKLSISNTKL